MWLNGPEQWEDHCIGKKHKKAAWRRVVERLLARARLAERERIASERAAGSGGERAAAKEGAAA